VLQDYTHENKNNKTNKEDQKTGKIQDVLKAADNA